MAKATVKKTTAAKTTKAAAPVVEVKETVAAPVEEVKEAPVAAPVKEEAPKAAPAKKAAAPKAEPAKEEAPKAEKKAPAKKAAAKKAEVKAAISVQFSGKEYTMEKLVEIAKDVWKYDLGQDEAAFASVELYVKPEESAVYYVINGDTTGSFAI